MSEQHAATSVAQQNHFYANTCCNVGTAHWLRTMNDMEMF